MVYENPVGHPTFCMQPVEWVGPWKFMKGWTKVWSCERHTDEFVGSAQRRLSTEMLMPSVVGWTVTEDAHFVGTPAFDLDRTLAVHAHAAVPRRATLSTAGPPQRWRRGCRCPHPDRTPWTQTLSVRTDCSVCPASAGALATPRRDQIHGRATTWVNLGGFASAPGLIHFRNPPR